MDAIGELIGAIIVFIFEVLVLLLEGILALIFPSRRKSLKEKWRRSPLLRAEIITSFILFLLLAIFAGYLILKIKGCSSQPERALPVSIETTPTNENSTTIEIKISDDLKDKATDYIKEKWKNRN